MICFKGTVVNATAPACRFYEYGSSHSEMLRAETFTATMNKLRSLSTSMPRVKASCPQEHRQEEDVIHMRQNTIRTIFCIASFPATRVIQGLKVSDMN